MIPDVPNTPTCQSNGMNNTPRYPLHRPVTCNSVWAQLNTLRLQLHLQSWHLLCRHGRHERATTLRARPFPHIMHLRNPRYRHYQFHTTQWFWLDSTKMFRQDSTQVFPTQSNPRSSTVFDSHFFLFNSHLT